MQKEDKIVERSLNRASLPGELPSDVSASAHSLENVLNVDGALQKAQLHAYADKKRVITSAAENGIYFQLKGI